MQYIINALSTAYHRSAERIWEFWQDHGIHRYEVVYISDAGDVYVLGRTMTRRLAENWMHRAAVVNRGFIYGLRRV